jgi:glutamine synthetase
MLEMVKQDIVPAVSDYVAELCTNVAAKQAISDKLPCKTEKNIIEKLSEGNDKVSALAEKLEGELKKVDMNAVKESSQAMAHKIIPLMEETRKVVDSMEKITSSDYWPYPTYFDLLYSVK